MVELGLYGRKTQSDCKIDIVEIGSSHGSNRGNGSLVAPGKGYVIEGWRIESGERV